MTIEEIEKLIDKMQSDITKTEKTLSFQKKGLENLQNQHKEALQYGSKWKNQSEPSFLK